MAIDQIKRLAKIRARLPHRYLVRKPLLNEWQLMAICSKSEWVATPSQYVGVDLDEAERRIIGLR